MNADRRSDMTGLLGAFCYYANFFYDKLFTASMITIRKIIMITIGNKTEINVIKCIKFNFRIAIHFPDNIYT